MAPKTNRFDIENSYIENWKTSIISQNNITTITALIFLLLSKHGIFANFEIMVITNVVVTITQHS